MSCIAKVLRVVKLHDELHRSYVCTVPIGDLSDRVGVTSMLSKLSNASLLGRSSPNATPFTVRPLTSINNALYYDWDFLCFHAH